MGLYIEDGADGSLFDHEVRSHLHSLEHVFVDPRFVGMGVNSFPQAAQVFVSGYF